MDVLDLVKYALSIIVIGILLYSALFATRGKRRQERRVCARCGRARPTGTIGAMAMCEPCGLLTQSRHLAVYSFFKGMAIFEALALLVIVVVDARGFAAQGWDAFKILGVLVVAPVALVLWIRTQTQFERWQTGAGDRRE